MKKKTLNFKTIVWKEGKHYVAQCLNVDVSSFGNTRKEAISNLQEALDLYFEDIKNPKISEVIRPELIKTKIVHA